MKTHARTLCKLAAASVALALSACASAPGGNPHDPWENYNRSMTRFNTAVDDAVMRPVATAYQKAMPQPVRTGVGNFFDNLSDVWSFVNNVLQAKPERALHSFWRVIVNTTIGLGGVLDPASEMRIRRYREDFGQTLAWWGVPPGPYFVVPLLGPSILRDALSMPADYYGNPRAHVHSIRLRNSLAALSFVDARSRLLGVEDVLSGASIDDYAFTRDAWLQKRRNDVYDGNPPAEPGQDDGYPDYDNPDAAPAAQPDAAPASQADGGAP